MALSPTSSRGSSGSSISVIGPYAVAFNTAGASSQASLVALASGTKVLRAWARVTVSWTADAVLRIGAGGSTAVSDGDYWTVSEYGGAGTNLTPQEDAGAYDEAAPPTTTPKSVVTLLTAGFLIVHIGGSPIAGAATVYAEIVSP